ncbi:probable WRKY transcription factor protein 1 [Aphidius gifuensis]|nr:probable WRKY transcription factor protein 1 [Aphidius gifuensis]
MEFYKSRDIYMNCEELDPDLTKIIPESSEENSNETTDGVPTESPSKLNGLGDRISCLQAKYFDKNPLDNPLFMERRIDMVEMPEKFLIDSKLMKHKFANIKKSNNEANIDIKLSKKPESFDHEASDTSYVNQIEHPSIKLSRANNGKALNHRKLFKERHNYLKTTTTTTTQAPYEDEIYEDVMGTIKNLSKMRKSHKDKTTKLSRAGTIINRPPLKIPKKNPNRQFDSLVAKSSLRKKLPRYKTKRVSYKTRGRTESTITNEPRTKKQKKIEHFRTVRIHKRSIYQENNDSYKNNEKKIETIGTTGLPIINTQASERIYTIIKREKNSKPKIHDKHGKFTAENKTIITRRNEPTYNSPDSFEEFHNKKNNKKNPRRYDVHEEINENQETSKEKVKKKNPESREIFDDEEKIFINVDKSKENIDDDTVEIPDEQVERPSEFYEENSSEKLEEESKEELNNDDDEDDDDDNESDSKESFKNKKPSSMEEIDDDTSKESYDDEEKNVGEKSISEMEFDRFVGRPTSFGENYYDPKYADLGPRINKPHFHHPEFDSLEFDMSSDEVKRLSKFAEDSNEKVDNEKNKKFSSKYEYPWKKEEELKNNKQNNKYHDDYDNSEESMSPSMIKNVKYENKIKKNINSDEIIDSDKMSSNNLPIKYSSKTKNNTIIKPTEIDAKKHAENIRKNVLNFIKIKNNNKLTTTFKPQILPTSATLIKYQDITTPMTDITTIKIPKYTIKSSLKRSNNHQRNQDTKLLKSASTISEVTASPKLTKRRQSLKYTVDKPENITTTISARRKKSTTTTTTPTSLLINTNKNRRKLINNTMNKSVSKPVKMIKHRSRVSQEQIITKTIENNNLNGPNNHTTMNKVSIMTKETPDHIFRTEEINKNGQKNKFITILPSNKSQELSEELIIDDINHDDNNESNENNHDYLGDSIASNVHYVAHLMNQVSPIVSNKFNNDEMNNKTSSELNIDNKKSVIKYTKEPDKRLYHFINDDHDHDNK